MATLKDNMLAMNGVAYNAVSRQNKCEPLDYFSVCVYAVAPGECDARTMQVSHGSPATCYLVAALEALAPLIKALPDDERDKVKKVLKRMG